MTPIFSVLAGFAVCACATLTNKTTKTKNVDLNAEPQTPRRLRWPLRGQRVRKQNCDNKNTSDPRVFLFRSCCFLAVRLRRKADACPQSPFTQPAKKCVFSA